MVLDLFVDSKRFIRHIVSHITHACPERVPLPRFAEINVVDIAARSVRHHGHKRRIQAIGPNQLLNPIGEDCEVVRADMAGGVTANVVQAIVGE